LDLQIATPGIPEYWHVEKRGDGQFKQRFVFLLHIFCTLLRYEELKF